MPLRIALGAAIALAIALAARKARALSPSGAAAAVFVGACASGAGWGWAELLILYFVVTSALSRLPSRYEQEMERIVEKGGTRDAMQVFANGGVFAACAVGMLVAPSSALIAASAGSLAAAAADSWATEFGSRYGRAPRSIITRAHVPRGESGGVTLAGLLATVAGSAFVGIAAMVLMGAPLLPVMIGGIAGSLADSLLGAVVQSRRWCPSCRELTERRIHVCGAVTEQRHGWDWLENDVVNVACTVVGAAVAVFAARFT